MRTHYMPTSNEGSLERELGFLRSAFSDEELAELDKVLFQPMSDEDLALWYDPPIMQESEPLTRDFDDLRKMLRWKSSATILCDRPAQHDIINTKMLSNSI